MSPPRANVKVVGHQLEPEHHRLRDFLTRAAQPYEWHEAESPEAAITHRAIEGFTRSLAKEIGAKGSTAQLVRVGVGPYRLDSLRVGEWRRLSR